MLDGFSMGDFQKNKSGCENSHSTEPEKCNSEFIAITPASVHEVKLLDQISFEAESFYVMDRGYIDFEQMYRIHLARAFLLFAQKIIFSSKESIPIK